MPNYNLEFYHHGHLLTVKGPVTDDPYVALEAAAPIRSALAEHLNKREERTYFNMIASKAIEVRVRRQDA